MSVKRPPRRRVVSFRCRLADIVKNSRPAEPQAVAVECHVVQYLQCMSEVIFMSVQSHLFHAFKPTHLRKYKRQQTGHIHQFETDGGHRRKDYLVYLGNNALAGNYPDTLPVAFDGLEGLRRYIETQLSGEPHGPHHPQRVVGEGDVGIAGSPDDVLTHIFHAAERVFQLSERIAVERPGQRIDGKVTPQLVVAQGTRLHDRFAGIPRIGLLSGTDELHLHSFRTEHSCTERLENRHIGACLPSQGFSYIDAASHDDHVDIRARTTKIIIAHISPYHIGPQTHAVHYTGNLPENGKRERFSHLLTIISIIPSPCRDTSPPYVPDRSRAHRK